MDGLGEQPGQGALGAFAVHGVEPEHDPEERGQETHEHDQREGHRVGGHREQLQEQGGDPLGVGSDLADPSRGGEHRRRRGDPEHRHQHDEAPREEVVGQLLAGDDPPTSHSRLLGDGGGHAVTSSWVSK